MLMNRLKSKFNLGGRMFPDGQGHWAVHFPAPVVTGLEIANVIADIDLQLATLSKNRAALVEVLERGESEEQQTGGDAAKMVINDDDYEAIARSYGFISLYEYIQRVGSCEGTKAGHSIVRETDMSFNSRLNGVKYYPMTDGFTTWKAAALFAQKHSLKQRAKEAPSKGGA